jgi:hypothetical protein
MVVLDFSEAVLGNANLSCRLLEREPLALPCGDALLREGPEANAVAEGDATRLRELDDIAPEKLTNPPFDEGDLAPGERTTLMILLGHWSDSCLPPNGSRLSCSRARTTLPPTDGRRRGKQETRRPAADRFARRSPRLSAAADC